MSQGWVTVTRAQGDPIPAAEFCADLLRQLGYEGFTDENADLFARRAALTTRDYGETLTLGDLYQLLRDALTFPDTEGVTPAQRLVDKGLCTQEQIQDLFPEELTARQIADRHMAAVFELDVFYTKKAYKNNQQRRQRLLRLRRRTGRHQLPHPGRRSGGHRHPDHRGDLPGGKGPLLRPQRRHRPD